jgi:alkylated DNA repair dioxygenase AlkB
MDKLRHGAWVLSTTIPGDLVSDEDFETLWEMHPETVGSVMMYGKMINTPRFHKSYLKSYKFTGQELVADMELGPILQSLKDWVEETLGYGEFDQVLVNWYRNGNDYIGAHSDSESQLVPDSEIVSIALGATRKFRLRNRKNETARTIEMPNGTVLVMGGTCQKFYKHEVVKVAGKKGEAVGRRINITFRKWA